MKAKIENRLSYKFENKELLQQALLIPSKAKTKQQSYERLEFLGDRVIALVIARILYEKYPQEQQGDLSKRFVALVRKETLSEIAETIELLEDVKTFYPNIPIKDITESMQSDLLESLIAAIYLDGGFDAAESVIEQLWESYFDKDLKPPRDAKTELQEWAQARGYPLPKYEILERSGAAHKPEFMVRVEVKGEKSTSGKAGSKRAAEQEAALKMLQQVQ